MEQQEVWALAIFLVVYAFVISGTIHRTLIAMTGAVLAVLPGLADQAGVIQYINFNTLGLLIGWMMIVNMTAETGVFRYIAVWTAQKAKAEPARILVALMILAAVCSAFLNNMITAVLMVPVILNITRILQVSPFPYLAAHIAASSAGGTATMIGSTPNIMIGSAVKELGFSSFLFHLAPFTVLVLLALYIPIFLMLFSKQLKATPEQKDSLMSMDPSELIADRKLLVKCLAAIMLVMIGLFMHEALKLEPAAVALSGAFLLLLFTSERPLENVLSRVQWTVIFFIAGLFAAVSALAETGVITRFAEAAMNWTGGDLALASMLILWISAIASALGDNIPLVAAMIPLIQEMGAFGAVNLEPLWWSLAVGAGLGGSGTLIGAGVSLAAADRAAKEGHAMRFLPYLKLGFPLMILSVALSSVYILIRYLL